MMKGDFTRDTFDRAKHFSRVLMQQGRVQLDADWNEQTSILLHYLRTVAADILGPHAGPDDAMGFDLVTNETVQGWVGAGLNLDEQWKKIEPDPDRRSVLRNAVEKGNDAVICTGRYYVHGVLVENHRPILYTEQAGYPFPPEMELGHLQEKELVFYLDVWERHITYAQDDYIREVALGGADTCTRAQVVWQVKILVRDNQDAFDCSSVEALLARKHLPKLRARAWRGTPSPDLCSGSPESRYRGLENQLYRVEVHEITEIEGRGKGDEVPPATFKWSRDNGSVVFPIVSLIGATVVVADLGRDQCSSLKPGDWVEISDDDLVLRQQSGPLARVEAVDRDELKITLEWPNDVTEPPTLGKHPMLRRWDHAGDLAAHHGALPIIEPATPDDGWIELEDGVQVRFAEHGEYRVGDYWLIPARVVTSDVEWPTELDSDGVPKLDPPAAQPPHGPKHDFAPLFHLTVEGGKRVMNECRLAIKPPCEIRAGR